MTPLLTEEEIAFLASLAESGVDYMVVGMSSAILQGVPGTTQDIDLWLRNGQNERLSEACERVGARFAWRASPPMVVGRGLEQLEYSYPDRGPPSAAGQQGDWMSMSAKYMVWGRLAT